MKIIGDGDINYKNFLKEQVVEKNISNNIIFSDGIYDDGILFKEFNKSFACISPKQAGLSVLKV